MHHRRFIGDNYITSIPKNTFSGLSSLSYLSVTENIRLCSSNLIIQFTPFGTFNYTHKRKLIYFPRDALLYYLLIYPLAYRTN